MNGYAKGTIGAEVESYRHSPNEDCFLDLKPRGPIGLNPQSDRREKRDIDKLSKLILRGDIFDSSDLDLDELDDDKVYPHPGAEYSSGNFHVPHQTHDRAYDGITPNTENDIDD